MQKLIEKDIQGILNKNFNIRVNISENLLNHSLIGEPFNLDSIDLVYLYFEIEKKYNITIPPNMILNYEFETINKIANIIITLKNKCTL
jgi:peptide maturation system acyl carrier-related protein